MACRILNCEPKIENYFLKIIYDLTGHYKFMYYHLAYSLSNEAQVSIHRLFGNESWPYCKLLMEIIDTLKFPIYLVRNLY